MDLSWFTPRLQGPKFLLRSLGSGCCSKADQELLEDIEQGFEGRQQALKKQSENLRRRPHHFVQLGKNRVVGGLN